MPNPNFPNNPGYNLYVGARYVPIFSDVNNGVWTDNVAYEPLTIVTYLGDSYTSKTYVPAGIAPTNETYWAKTGNYNAQVETLNQKINSVEQSVTSLDGEVAQIDLELENLNKDILQKTASASHNKRVFCMGDSTNMASGWGSYIHQLLGCETTILGNIGAGFHHQGTSAPYTNMNFLSTLQKYVETVSVSDLELYDTFVIVGGYNDAYYDSSPLTTIIPYIAPFFAYVSRTFKNAEIIYMPNASRESNSLKTFGRLLKIAEAIPPYVRNVKNMMCVGFGHTTWFSDTIHQSSYAEYAKYVAEAIVSPNFKYFNQLALTGGFLPPASQSQASISDFEIYISAIGSSENITFHPAGGPQNKAFTPPFDLSFSSYRNLFPLTIIASTQSSQFVCYTAAVSITGMYSGLSQSLTPISADDSYSFHIRENLMSIWSGYAE